MKTMITTILIALLLNITVSSKDNPNSSVVKQIKQLTDDGYYTWSKESFLKASALCQRILAIEENDPYANYYLSYSSYRLMNIALTENSKEEMQKYAGLAKGHAAVLFEISNFKSEAHTLMAAILMMELALEPSKGMEYSQKIHGHLGKAEAMDKNNPRVNLIRGVMMFNTPEQFGGGANTSIGILKSAEKQFARPNKSALMPSWGKYETKAWIGQALQQLSKLEEAVEVYKKLLTEKPDYNWVKHDLLPRVEKKLSQVNEAG
jgi:tetratricopeptide (TPR) repeat protein